MFVLVVITHGKRGIVSQIGFQHAVADFPLLLVFVAGAKATFSSRAILNSESLRCLFTHAFPV